MGVVAKGSSITFSCLASSWPADPSYSWISHKGIVVSRESKFTINEASWDSSGEYQCVVNNNILTRKESTSLKIECK